MEQCLARRQGNPNEAGEGTWTDAGKGTSLQEAWVSKRCWKGSKMGKEVTEDASARCHGKQNRRPVGETCDRGKGGGRKNWEKEGVTKKSTYSTWGGGTGPWKTLGLEKLDKSLLLFSNSPKRNVDKKNFPAVPDKTNWDMPYNTSYWSQVSIVTRTNGSELANKYV